MPELSTGQLVNAGQRCYAILEDGTRGRAEQNADRFHPERHRQPAKDHFGGIRTSLPTVGDGAGGTVDPTKSPRSGARAVLCAAFFHCAMLSTILLVASIEVWLSCK